MSVEGSFKKVEDVANDSDFNTLTSWLMSNSKDKEVRAPAPCAGRGGRSRCQMLLPMLRPAACLPSLLG
jgi:hypothetical protein